MRYRMLVLAVTVTLLAPSVARADRPVREVFPAPADFTVEACEFPVLIHTEGHIVRMTWFDDDGTPIRAVETYPGAKQVFTNSLTQEQIVIPVVGPAVFEFSSDGSTTLIGTGPWSWYPVNPVTGESGIFISTGRFTLIFDDEGNPSFRLLSGQIRGLCPALT